MMIGSGKKKNKYNAIPVIIDGYFFPSIKEGKRYAELTLLKRAGDIIRFYRQVPFYLPGKIVYRLDFLIYWKNKEITHEDTKGFQTAVFKIKRKQVEEIYGIKIITT